MSINLKRLFVNWIMKINSEINSDLGLTKSFIHSINIKTIFYSNHTISLGNTIRTRRNFMLDIRTPEQYINEAGSIKKAGEYIGKYGKNAFIIASSKALSTVSKDLFESLEKNSISYELISFTGYPTLAKASEYAEIVKNTNKSVIIAIGGGKVQDVSKATGDLSRLPVIAIPTIAATCASWAAVSIIYNDEGDYEQVHLNRFTPRLIIADPEIILNAPERYLKAGIVDTYAKWYETIPGITGKDDALPLQISVNGAKVALDLLNEKGLKAVEDSRKGIVSKEGIDTIDAIIYLAGFVGSFVGERAFAGFAHPFYHASRRIPSTRHILHGELVSYGLITQLILEGKPEQEIYDVIQKFAQFDVAFTLEDIGLAEDSKNKLTIIAKRVLKEFPGYTALGFGTTVEEIVAGLYKADEYVREYRTKYRSA